MFYSHIWACSHFIIYLPHLFFSFSPPPPFSLSLSHSHMHIFSLSLNLLDHYPFLYFEEGISILHLHQLLHHIITPHIFIYHLHLYQDQHLYIAIYLMLFIMFNVKSYVNSYLYWLLAPVDVNQRPNYVNIVCSLWDHLSYPLITLELHLNIY